MDIKELKDILLNDFWKFVKFMNIKKENKTLIPHRKITNLYYNICKKLEELNKNTLILLPRRHLKTLIASLFITWYSIKYPDNAVIILTDTRKKGIRLLRGIKNFFYYHQNFKNIFSEYTLSRKGNNEDTFTLGNRKTFAKEPNIAVYSIEQPVQSARADLVVYEDIVSDKFTVSEANRKMVRTNLQSINAILEKNSKKLVTGTRYTIDDPYNDIIQNSENWDIISHSIFDNEHEKDILCSYVMAINEVEKIKKEVTPSFFASQYLNSPISSVSNPFTLEDYAIFDSIDMKGMVKKVLSVDLSDGIGKDLNAFTIVTQNKKNELFIWDCFGSNEIDTINLYWKIYNYVKKYNIDTVLVELNRNGKTILENTFYRLDHENNHNINFVGIQNTENKHIRIEKLEPIFRSKRLLLHKSNLPDLIEEIRYYNPYSKKSINIDILDSLATAVNYLESRKVKKEKEIGVVTGEFKGRSIF